MQISAISRALINRPNLMINNDSRNSVTTPEFKNQNFQFSKVASDCLKVNVLPLSKTLAFEGALRVLCKELKSDCLHVKRQMTTKVKMSAQNILQQKFYLNAKMN